MKRFLLLSFLSLALLSNAQTYFRTYGGNNIEQAYSIAQRGNNQFVMAGSTRSTGAGGDDAWLFSTDSTGAYQWSQTYGGSGNDDFIFVIPTSDGGFAACGETFSSSNNNGDAWIVKTDASGTVQWSKVFGGSLYDDAYSMEQTSDGGYIVCGLTENTTAFNYDAFLLKLDSAGNAQWSKVYGSSTIDHAVSVRSTTDGGYIFSGKSMATSPGLSDAWIVKTDASGDTSWCRLIGGNGWDEGMSIRETANGYIVCGGSNSFGASDYDFLLFTMDANGNVQWAKTYGGSHVEASYCIVPAGTGWIFTGYTETFGPGHSQRLAGPSTPPVVQGTDSANAFVVRTDANGDTLWCRAYGGTRKEESFHISENPNGGYIIGGYTGSFGVDSTDAYMIHIEGNGSAGCAERAAHPNVGAPSLFSKRYPFSVGTNFPLVTFTPQISAWQPTALGTQCLSTSIPQEQTASTNIYVAPNPAVDQFHVRFADASPARISLFDATGRQLQTIARVNGGEVSLPCADYARGLYVLVVEQNGQQYSMKLVKE